MSKNDFMGFLYDYTYKECLVLKFLDVYQGGNSLLAKTVRKFNFSRK